MTILSDMIQRRMDDRAAQGRSEQLQQLVGQPEQFPQGPGGQVPGPPTQATGVMAMDPQNQRAGFAQGLMQIPALQGEGISLFDAALSQRAQMWQQTQGETARLMQDQDQFDVSHNLDMQKWGFDQSLKSAQHAMKLRDSEQDFYLGKLQIDQSKLSMKGMQQAQAEVERKKALIPGPMRDEVSNLIDGQAVIAEQLANFEDDYAINSPLVVIGKAKLELLRKVDGKSQADMNKLAFWEGERELMLKLRNDLFGGTVTEQDDALLAELSVNESDGPQDIRRKLTRSLAMIQKKLKRRSAEILHITGGTRDIRRDFNTVDTDVLMSQLGDRRDEMGVDDSQLQQGFSNDAEAQGIRVIGKGGRF